MRLRQMFLKNWCSLCRIRIGESPKKAKIISRYTGLSANGVRVVIKLAPLMHCLAVFLMEATTVRYFLSLAPCEMPKEKGKIWKKPQSWKELSWENRIRLLYLRLVHCLTTVLVPWVQRYGIA